MIYLLLYLTIGFVFIRVKPVANIIKNEKARLYVSFPSSKLAGRRVVLPGKIQFFFIFLNLVSLIFYPFLLLLLVWEYFQKKKENIPEPYVKRSVIPLYFSRISGYGTLQCHTCGHEQSLTAFLHGDDDDEPSFAAGFQCQSCGKCKTFDENTIQDDPKLCDCGGSFSREEIIFCPACTKYDVAFKTKFLF